MGKSGRYRRRRRPLTTREAKRLSQREKKIGLNEADRLDHTGAAPPKEQPRIDQPSQKSKGGKSL